MPEIATYTAAVAIAFVVLTTLLMLWFAYLGERSDAHEPAAGTDPEDEAVE